MSELHVGGGLFAKNKCKTLEEAVRKAHPGDTIIVHVRRNVLKNGLRIAKPLYIEGKGNGITIVAPAHKMGLQLAGNVNFSLTNVTIMCPNQANGLGLAQNAGGRINLDNCKFRHGSKVLGRELYPALSINQGQVPVTLNMNHCDVDLPSIYVSQFSADQCHFGSPLSGHGTIRFQTANIGQNEFTNLDMLTDNAQYTATLNGCRTEGGLTLMGHFNVDQLTCGAFTYYENDRNVKKRIDFAKDQGLLQDNVASVGVCPSKLSDSVVTFKNMKFETKMQLINSHDNEVPVILQKRAWFNFVNSDITISDTKIPLSDLKNVTSKGDLSLVNVQDHSHWNNSGTTISDRNSSSSLVTAPGQRKAGEKSALEELDSLIGLDPVKKFVHEQIAKAKLTMERRKRGLLKDDKNSQGSLHMVFGGEAGTGKTTVARLVAKALYEEGVLKSNKFTEVGQSDLVAGHVGQTAPKTHKVCMSALDGVLFVDEAYSLAPSKNGGNTFNDEAVAQLIADAENYRDRLVVILAGYEADMRDFFNRGNEGLKSRFTNWIEFPNYSSDELNQIMMFQLKKQHWKFDNNQTKQVAEYGLDQLVGIAQRGSGNGRAVRNFVQKLDDARSARLTKDTALDNITDEALQTFVLSDVQQAFATAKRQSEIVEHGAAVVNQM